MDKLKRFRVVAVIAVLSLRLAACGGNPNGASDGGVTLEGSLVGGTFGAASVRSGSAAVLTVVVAENPAMTATIGADGRFTLRGLPEGSFTLDFFSDGTPIGSLAFTEVKPNQALTVTVSVSGSTVVLVEQRRNGIGHGDLEIQGRVDQILTVNPAGDSRFVIDGKTVIVRPGQTAIREGNRARVVGEITLLRQVHVKGVWITPAPPTGQEVLAWEIKLQGPETGPSPSPTPGATCMINGGRAGEGIELEGRVAGGAFPAFTMTVNGNRASGPVTVEAGSATVQCSPASGPNAPTPAQCQARVSGSQRIHVRGTLTACTLTSASVSASRVTVQGN
jgi:hypothetical protein